MVFNNYECDYETLLKRIYKHCTLIKLSIKDFVSKCDCEFGHIYWRNS